MIEKGGGSPSAAEGHRGVVGNLLPWHTKAASPEQEQGPAGFCVLLNKTHPCGVLYKPFSQSLCSPLQGSQCFPVCPAPAQFSEPMAAMLVGSSPFPAAPHALPSSWYGSRSQRTPVLISQHHSCPVAPSHQAGVHPDMLPAPILSHPGCAGNAPVVSSHKTMFCSYSTPIAHRVRCSGTFYLSVPLPGQKCLCCALMLLPLLPFLASSDLWSSLLCRSQVSLSPCVLGMCL